MSVKISIIIPVYNGSNFLKNAIECALNQSYSNIEVIVINDGSNDNNETEKIALSFGNKIKYYYKSNGGVSSALNLGIQLMTGDYFSWLSHDDLYSSEKIKDSVELLMKSNNVNKKCIAFTGGYFIDNKCRKINDFKLFFRPQKLYSGLDIANIMTKKGTLNGCCMLIPKEAFKEVACFDERLRYSQDSLMWYQLFLSGYSLISDNKPNVMYRLHCNQTSQISKKIYRHDALIIAKKLANPLVEIDPSGKLIFQYTKRLTKYDCKETVDWLCEYIYKKGMMTPKMKLILNFSKFIGFWRYRIVSNSKRILLLFKERILK